MAVTSVGRDARLRARVAAGLLALAGRALPVSPGEERPLLRDPGRFNWFGHEERCIAAGVPTPLDCERAPGRILRAAREVPGLEIAAIGPLTNLARALALEPDLPDRVGGVTIMGGHLREARLGERVAPPGIDYNLCSDPEAAVAVLGAGFRITLVTADVTLATWMRESDLARLERAGPVARELARQVRLWTPVQRRVFTQMGGTLAPDNAAYLHDPLTLLSLVDASPLLFEDLRIVPTIEDGVMRTREVPADSGLGGAMRAATAVDAEAARAAIVERLLRL